jgi:hypothetical protein
MRHDHVARTRPKRTTHRTRRGVPWQHERFHSVRTSVRPLLIGRSSNGGAPFRMCVTPPGLEVLLGGESAARTTLSDSQQFPVGRHQIPAMADLVMKRWVDGHGA